MRVNLLRRQMLLAATALTTCGLASAAAALRPDAQRIVALDWAGAEALLALGIAPLAVADAPAYREWFPTPALPGGSRDLGPRWEPNRELLAYLRPSLILTASSQAPDLQSHARVAPLFPMQIYQADGHPYDHAASALLRLAGILGLADRAHARLSAADAEIAAARDRLQPHAGRPVYVVILNEDGRHATFFGRNSLAQDVLDRVGLENAWSGASSAIWGYAAEGIESLARAPDALILCIRQGRGTERALARLRASTLWNGLEAVKKERVRVLAPVFPFAGVPSAARLANQMAEAVAGILS